MDAVIRTDRLTKHYGPVVGIESVDLEVGPGEVFGFLGPNGAGKTTTIRCLMDLLRPTRGRAEVLGLDPRSAGVAVRRRVGYLPGELALYGGMTAHEHLLWLAGLRGAGAANVRPLSARLDLDLSRRVDQLSTGNRQKVGIVQAFMHDPSLLILDEPTRGLDPLMQQEFNALVREARAAGRTVFLSSHVLDEVEAVADRVAIILRGSLIVTDSVAVLKRQAVRRVEIRFSEDVDASAFADLPGVRQAEFAGRAGQFIVDGPMDSLVKAASAFEVDTVTSHEPDLEEIFLAFYDEAVDPEHDGGGNDGGDDGGVYNERSDAGRGDDAARGANDAERR